MADNDNVFGWASDDSATVQPHFEYHRKNRWVLRMALPDGLNEVDATQLRLNCYSASRPNMNFDDVTVHRINGEVFLPGKGHYEPLSVSFYDALSVDQRISPSGILEKWRQLIWQPESGDAFGAVTNLKGLANLEILGPSAMTPGGPAEPEPDATPDKVNEGGAINQRWLFQGLYPQTINYGDLTYENAEVQTVEVTFRYDRAYIKAGS